MEGAELLWVWGAHASAARFHGRGTQRLLHARSRQRVAPWNSFGYVRWRRRNGGKVFSRVPARGCRDRWRSALSATATRERLDDRPQAVARPACADEIGLTACPAVTHCDSGSCPVLQIRSRATCDLFRAWFRTDGQVSLGRHLGAPKPCNCLTNATRVPNAAQPGMSMF